MTPSGKVDRRALPGTEVAIRLPATEYVAPRTSGEATLAEIWRQVLGVRRVGFDDNFFELGGDSIRSVRIVARAHEQGLHLTPRQIFEHPTVARLVALTVPCSP